MGFFDCFYSVTHSHTHTKKEQKLKKKTEENGYYKIQTWKLWSSLWNENLLLFLFLFALFWYMLRVYILFKSAWAVHKSVQKKVCSTSTWYTLSRVDSKLKRLLMHSNRLWLFFSPFVFAQTISSSCVCSTRFVMAVVFEPTTLEQIRTQFLCFTAVTICSDRLIY